MIACVRTINIHRRSNKLQAIDRSDCPCRQQEAHHNCANCNLFRDLNSRVCRVLTFFENGTRIAVSIEKAQWSADASEEFKCKRDKSENEREQEAKYE